jgi:hypothetical protein
LSDQLEGHLTDQPLSYTSQSNQQRST